VHDDDDDDTIRYATWMLKVDIYMCLRNKEKTCILLSSTNLNVLTVKRLLGRVVDGEEFGVVVVCEDVLDGRIRTCCLSWDQSSSSQ
jgi:hypothetical protein